MLGKLENRRPAEKKIQDRIFRGARETGEPETSQEKKFGISKKRIPDSGSVQKVNLLKGFQKKKLTFEAPAGIPDPGSVQKVNFLIGF